jgi:hypothetical protein
MPHKIVRTGALDAMQLLGNGRLNVGHVFGLVVAVAGPGTFGIIQGMFGIIQGMFRIIQGTFRII